MNSHSTRTHETSLNDKKKIIPCPWKITRVHVPHNYWYWFKMTRRPNKTTDNDKTKHGSLLKLLVCWLPVCQLSPIYSLEKYPRSVFLSFSPLVLFPWSFFTLTPLVIFIFYLFIYREKKNPEKKVKAEWNWKYINGIRGRRSLLILRGFECQGLRSCAAIQEWRRGLHCACCCAVLPQM